MVRGVLALGILLFSWTAQGKGILILGDSISAAYGLEKSQGWVALLDQQLQQQCRDFPVINASVSGETSAGGNSRLPALLQQYQPELVVIELGGNDGLRGLSPLALATNLRQMIEHSRAAEAEPVLLGMKIPPNYGEHYTLLFEQQFQQVANAKDVPLMPFFLDGVVEQGGLQEDGIHPTAEAQPLLLDNAMKVLAPLLPSHCHPPGH